MLVVHARSVRTQSLDRESTLFWSKPFGCLWEIGQVEPNRYPDEDRGDALEDEEPLPANVTVSFLASSSADRWMNGSYPLRLAMPLMNPIAVARRPLNAPATATEHANIAILVARSSGLYQKQRLIHQHGSPNMGMVG